MTTAYNPELSIQSLTLGPFILSITLELGSLKTAESNRWAPLIKGNDEAGQSLRDILRIAYELSCDLTATARFFKKSQGGVRSHSKAIFNLVKSLIGNPGLNTEQLNTLARCSSILTSTAFPSSVKRYSPAPYLSSQDYLKLIPRLGISPTPISANDVDQSLKRKLVTDSTHARTVTSHNIPTIFLNPSAFPSVPAPEDFRELPEVESSPVFLFESPQPLSLLMPLFVEEISKNLAKHPVLSIRQWKTLLSDNGFFGDSIRSILQIASTFSANTQSIIEIISNSSESASTVIFNLVKWILENKTSAIDRDTLKSKLLTLHHVIPEESGLKLKLSHYSELNTRIDFASLEQNSLEASVIMPPSQIPVTMSANKSIMFKVPTSEDIETRTGTKRKRETVINAAEISASHNVTQLPTPSKTRR
jgi:hypothetical protein